MDLDPNTEEVIARVCSDKARTALRRWTSGKAGKLILANWAASGFSTAQLIGAYVGAPGEYTRSLIIKISSAERGDREERAHRNALNDAPREFALEHMAQLVGDPIPVDGGEWISFQQVAGGGFREMVEFDKMLCDWNEPAQACRRILISLFTEWNTDSPPDRCAMRDLLTDLLGQRLHARGTIRGWAAEHRHLLDQPRRFLRYGGSELFNPFALVSDDSPEGQAQLVVTRGKSHGDLHPGNLLVSQHPALEELKYCLVDLSRYRADGLLAWDPAYLLVTTVAKHLKAADVEPHLRESLRHWLIHPDSTAPPLHRELRTAISGINQAEDELAKRCGMIQEWRSQRLLCITAAALILTGRSKLLSAALREWFFWLAAHAATELVRAKIGFTPKDPITLPDPLISNSNVIHLNERRRREQLDPLQTTAQPCTAAPVHNDETWACLVTELRSVQLDAGDQATLAVHTEALRQLLAEPRGAAPAHQTRVEHYLNELTRTLSEALRPGTTDTEVRAAGTQANLLRTWLVDLLS